MRLLQGLYKSIGPSGALKNVRQESLLGVQKNLNRRRGKSALLMRMMKIALLLEEY